MNRFSQLLLAFLLFFNLLPTCMLAQKVQLTYFDLNKVKLLDSPFLNAMQVNKTYLLEMDVDRLLAPYMLEAGIAWEAERYGNWENTGLDGHIGGHYLSALAMLFAATGDVEVKERLDYMIQNLQKAQNAHGNGYLGGVPEGTQIWEQIKAKNIDAGGFSLNGKWVPLYNIHKIYAGLRDAYLIAGIAEAKPMLVALTDWFVDLTADFETADFQEILISEHGGLNEVFADVAEITGDLKYLDLAKNMSHQLILDPLAKQTDNLTGMHANTQIPKVIGFQKIAEMDPDQKWGDASHFFWENVVQERSISIGGNSVREHFHPKDDFSSMLSSEQGPETCNSYNMMRLSEKLFQASPDRKFIDFYERALYNHILSSQHPEKGGYVYFTSMRPNHYRVYSQPHQNFWCCVGSGMENHTKYGQVIYAKKEGSVFVNLFIASELDWAEEGVKITQTTQFPFEESTRLTIETDQPKTFNLQIRKPSWVKNEAFTLTINGQEQPIALTASGYVNLDRTWRSGDTIELSLPMETKSEYLPDGSNWVSFLHGPIVLAAKTTKEDLKGLFADDSRMGHVASGRLIPLTNTTLLKQTVEQEHPKKASQDLKFLLAANQIHDGSQPVELIPFFQVHDSRYQVYWPVVKEGEIDAFKEKIFEKDEYILRLEKATVDQVAAGEQQPESEHSYAGSKSQTGQVDGQFWRSTTDWFEYTLQNKNKEGKTLRISYTEQQSGNPFNLYINGKLLKKEQFETDTAPTTQRDYDISSFVDQQLVLRIESIDGLETEKITEVGLLRGN